MHFAFANAVVGHNDVRNELHAAACSCDPSAELEPLGLIPSHPTLRPAYILTSAALPSRLAALDVGVASPDAGCGGCWSGLDGQYVQSQAIRVCAVSIGVEH